jgi:hypothetical protein
MKNRFDLVRRQLHGQLLRKFPEIIAAIFIGLAAAGAEELACFNRDEGNCLPLRLGSAHVVTENQPAVAFRVLALDAEVFLCGHVRHLTAWGEAKSKICGQQVPAPDLCRSQNLLRHVQTAVERGERGMEAQAPTYRNVIADDLPILGHRLRMRVSVSPFTHVRMAQVTSNGRRHSVGRTQRKMGL